MSGQVVAREYLRNAAGAGIDGQTWSMVRLVDDSSVASGTTATDSDPNTSLAGMIAVDETTLGPTKAYPGPIKVTVTDSNSGAVRVQTSKATGITGAWRGADVTRAWRTLGTGVMPGIDNELAVSTNAVNLVITIASGCCVVALGNHALMYSYPASQTLTASAADGSNPRIDTVVARLYPPGVEQEGRAYLELVAGTPAASPSAPALHQSSTDYWQYPLANIRVDAGVTSLAVDKVTDRRTWCLLYPDGITPGDLFYVDADGKFARLAKGATGQYLKQGATVPAWDSFDASDVPSGIDAANIGAGSVSNTEFGYLDGVTSALQTQLNAKQASDAELTALAGLTSAADKVPYFTGSGTAAVADFTNAGRALVDDADASAQRTTLGLGTIAMQAASNVTITGGSITGITDVAVADGGTGASTAANARTNLGLGTIATQDASNVSISGGAVTGITDVAVADGGTGASTAANARTNLGLGSMATQSSSNVSITGGSVSAASLTAQSGGSLAIEAPVGNAFTVNDSGIIYFGTPGVGTPSYRVGTGNPEGVVSAATGSMFLSTNGATDSTLYVKTANNGGNTGWHAADLI